MIGRSHGPISQQVSRENIPYGLPTTRFSAINRNSNEESSSTLNLVSNSGRTKTKQKMRRIRRTFLLFITFDVIFMILLWIIYNQINGKAINTAFTDDVIHYSVSSSLFDVVALSILRFMILMLFYALIRSSHWFFIGITTLGSTGFIIAKTCLLTISKQDKSFTDYIILIVSFVLAWIEIWFFDYRVIPHEARLNEEQNNGERQRLLSRNESPSLPPVISTQQRRLTNLSDQNQGFYSPDQSDQSDDDETNLVEQRTIRAFSTVSQTTSNITTTVTEDPKQIEKYQVLANEIVTRVMEIYENDVGWSREAKSPDGNDIVMSKVFPKIGKVFRLSSVIPGKRDDIVQMLFEHQDDMPQWSPTVLECRVLQWIHNDLYISYQMTSEQAQGMVAKRDFVNLTARRFVGDVAILGAQACVFPQMPPLESCVRGENGPTAYILEKIDDSSTRITWLLNVDLKGWLPQYLINSSLANVQLTLIRSMREYLAKTNMTSSFSSSGGD